MKKFKCIIFQKALSHYLDFSFEDSFWLCMLTSTQSQILPNFNNNICHLGRLSAAKNRKLSASWCWGGVGWGILSLSTARLSLFIPVLWAALSLQDGSYFLHRHYVCFLGSCQGPSLFAFYLLSRSLSTLSLWPERSNYKWDQKNPVCCSPAPIIEKRGWVAVVIRLPACCLTKAIANTDFK